MTDERLATLASTTGIPATAWSALAPGWASKEQLRALHASGAGWKENPPDGAFAFAEVDGTGRVVGLALRAADGRKGGPAGAKRGLVVPTNLHKLADPVLVVEGASDVAACAAVGIAAVGRPSNRTGSEDVASMLEGRAMFIVGERDGKPDGSWPGRDGARHVARRIAARLGEPLPWTLPPTGAKDIRDWLNAKIAGSTALGDAINTLEGMAQDMPKERVALRVSEHAGVIVLDLGDETGRAISVSKEGWSLEPKSPVLFRRTALTSALPPPSPTTGDFEDDISELQELRKLINVDDSSWGLVAGYLVAAFMPEIPHPVLMLGGEQGTGKSTTSDMIVGVVDPSPAPRRTQPQQPRQWVMCAAGSWAVAIDNISFIPAWLSDAICKCVTGDGWVDRKLYTDADLTVLNFRRCIIFTSIDPGTLRGDLGDRLMILDLKTISPELRRPERELKEAFEEMRPRLLKAVLSALVLTLRMLPTISLQELPRMADFARVLGALDLACPKLTGGVALKTFMAQRGRIADEVVEADAVAAAIVRFMDQKDTWSGTAGGLLKAISPSPITPGWPRNARALGARLKRVRPALAQIGIVHTPPEESDKTRTHRLDKHEKEPPTPPEPPKEAESLEPDEMAETFEESLGFPDDAGSALRAGM